MRNLLNEPDRISRKFLLFEMISGDDGVVSDEIQVVVGSGIQPSEFFCPIRSRNSEVVGDHDTKEFRNDSRREALVERIVVDRERSFERSECI